MSQASVLAELDDASPSNTVVPRTQEQPRLEHPARSSDSPQRIAATPEDPNRKSSDSSGTPGTPKAQRAVSDLPKVPVSSLLQQTLGPISSQPLNSRATPPTPELVRQVVAVAAPEVAFADAVRDFAPPKNTPQKRSYARSIL